LEDEQIEGDVAILTLSVEIMGGPDDFQQFKDGIYKLIGQDVLKVMLDMAKVKRMNGSGAFAQGLEYGVYLHRDMGLESLRDYAPL